MPYPDYSDFDCPLYYNPYLENGADDYENDKDFAPELLDEFYDWENE